MVDYKSAFSAEDKVVRILAQHKKLNKYKLELHPDTKFDIDIVAKATGYEEFGIEVESTESGKWTAEEPFPMNWKKGVSVPARKYKFYKKYPLSLFVKVNHTFTRALVVPMSFIFSAGDPEEYRNSTDSHYRRNDFYIIDNAEHPALCFCKVEDLPVVVDEHFSYMTQLKRINAKYTDVRPTFVVKKEKEIGK